MRVYKCDRCGKYVLRTVRDFFVRNPTRGIYKLRKMECWDCSAKVESCKGLEDAVAGWNARAIDRDDLLNVADECERADVDGVTDWAARIRKAVGQ